MSWGASADFIPLPAALEHVAAYERAPKVALVRALADKVRSRGFVRYAWPPYHEGYEQLSLELFTDYPSWSVGPASIDWVEGSALMKDNGHPHPPCTVYGIEVSKADLLRLWPGRLKRAAKRPSNKRLIEQAAASGARITWPDGTQLDFSKAAEQQGNEVDQWFAKDARETQRD